MSDALPLPPRPNLEQYKKLAKTFQSACNSNDRGAVRMWSAHWLEKLARLQQVEITPQIRDTIDSEAWRMEQRWHKIKKSKESTTRCRLAEAQFFLACEHGFASWPKFAQHVAALARATSPVSNFEAAADAIVAGDAATLTRLLRADPTLARARSTREHRSTLLHYVSANGIEDFRQRTPPNIVEITKMLLAAGADVNAESEAYGGGSTALGLAATSLHPQRAGVQIALLQTLLQHGARMDQPSAGGNSQSIIRACLANGQPDAAEFFANLGAPLDLESAAALGKLSLVRNHFDGDGELKPPATRQQLEAGFLLACWYGREKVVEYMLDHAADVGLRNDSGQTGLHCATYGAHVDVIKLLLQRHAPVDAKDKEFSATPLDVALYQWDRSADSTVRERCYEVVEMLVQAGAKLDPQQWLNSDSRRPGMIDKIGSDPRMKAALRGE